MISEAALTPNLSILVKLRFLGFILSHCNDLVSTSQNALDTLQKSMHATWKEQRDERRQYQSCNIHIARSVDPFLQYQQTDQKLHVDFIVFLIDPSVVTALHETQVNLMSLNNLFGRHRICLVALDLNFSSAVSPIELRTFSKVYLISLLIGSVKQSDDCRHLSEQILNLCEVASGMINGIPAVRKM